MIYRRGFAAAILLFVAVLSGGCVVGSSSPDGSTPGGNVRSGQRDESATTPATSTHRIVGMKVDQFGTGWLDVRSYEYSGLDYEIARALSERLFHDPDPFVLPVSSGTREQALRSGAVQFFVATYSGSIRRAGGG